MVGLVVVVALEPLLGNDARVLKRAHAPLALHLGDIKAPQCCRFPGKDKFRVFNTIQFNCTYLLNTHACTYLQLIEIGALL